MKRWRKHLVSETKTESGGEQTESHKNNQFSLEAAASQ